MAEDTLALDAADRTIDELAKTGKVFLAAASLVRKAKDLQGKISGYEAQVDRMKEALTADRKMLEGLRSQIQDATGRLRVATEKADGAEAERDRRVSVVAQEEEAAIKQLRIVSERDREQIQRGTDALAAELDTKKQGIKADLEAYRQRLQTDLSSLEADIQTATDELQKARDAHAQFVESISRPMAGR